MQLFKSIKYNGDQDYLLFICGKEIIENVLYTL